ncbi:MAG: ABC-type transport auxiliary lipoprotein family protein [Pseudomonadota bacterium]
MIRRICKGLGLSVAALALASCAIVAPPPAPDVYNLTIDDGFQSVSGGTRSQLLITEPKVLSSLDNNRIVIKPNPSQIAFFGGVEWADRVPRLVQLHLSRAFSTTGKARAVGLPGDGLIIDHQLLFDLRAFQIEQTGSSFEAVVEIAVRILNDRNGRVIATETFSSSVPTSDDPVAAVNALNEAMNAVADDLVRWVFARI